MSSCVYDIPAESELRIEVVDGQKLTIQLKSGSAEIFGAELGEQALPLKAGNFAIFSWNGCTVEVVGSPESVYTSKDTPMVSYLNTHAALDRLRDVALATRQTGPRVIICGPADVGKSTLSRILINYAARAGKRPLFIDLDTGDSFVGIPGCLSMLAMDRPANIWDGFETFPPLCYHFGKLHPSDNQRLFKKVTSKMAKVAGERCEKDELIKGAGYIINSNLGSKEQIIEIQEAFKADTILVLDHERLFNSLTTSLQDANVKVVKLFKSGGVVARDESARSRARSRQIKRYFYGPPHEDPLWPWVFDIPFKDVKVYKVGAPPVPLACLPIGTDPKNNETELVALSLGPDLHQMCLSVMAAPPNWNETSIDILESEVLGFVSIQDIDKNRFSIKIISPAQYPLPRKPATLLVSSIQFSDALT